MSTEQHFRTALALLVGGLSAFLVPFCLVLIILHK